MGRTAAAAIGFVIAIGLIAFSVFSCTYLTNVENARPYYTRIENAHVEKTPGSSGGDYTYALACFGEDGQERELVFGAGRQLREGAFLQLDVMHLRGVVSWAEVDESELPPAAARALGTL